MHKRTVRLCIGKHSVSRSHARAELTSQSIFRTRIGDVRAWILIPKEKVLFTGQCLSNGRAIRVPSGDQRKFQIVWEISPALVDTVDFLLEWYDFRTSLMTRGTSQHAPHQQALPSSTEARGRGYSWFYSHLTYSIRPCLAMLAKWREVRVQGLDIDLIWGQNSEVPSK